MAKTIDARVVQKTATLAEWNASTLKTLDGEQLFIKSNVDDEVIGFKLGSNGKTFSELPYPKYSVRGKVNTQSVWQGAISGVYLPVEDGIYNGITVKLSDGYQVLYWDGTTLVKVLYDKLSIIIDNLQSDSATESLSANQGRLLNQSKENASNKSQELDESTTKYPSNKAVKDYVDSIIVEPSGVNFGGTISQDFIFDESTINTFWFSTSGLYNIPTIGEVNLTDNLNIISVNNSGEWDYKAVPINVEQDFLTYDTISELRSMPQTHISLISSGAVKGARLLGYDKKGDTDAIDYFVTDSTAVANGWTTIQVGAIKLHHDFGNEVWLENFGAKGNGKEFNGIGTMEFNSNVLTTSIPVFAPEDVGKSICIQGAGTLTSTSYRALSTIISAYDSPTQVRLNVLSSYAVKGARIVFGMDNTQALYRYNEWAKNRNVKIIPNFKGGIYLHKTPRWTWNVLNQFANGNGCKLINIATNPWDRASLFTAAGVTLQTKDGVIPGRAQGFLINTVNRDSRYIVCKNSSEAGNFVVGEKALIGSWLSTFNGFPPDYKYTDYVTITGVDTSTGTITFDEPLEFTHREDAIWSLEADAYQDVSGRASIVKLERGSKFGITQVFNDIDFSCETDSIGASRATGWYIEFNRCTFGTLVVTAVRDVRTNNIKQTNPLSNEFDKLVGTFIDRGSTWETITTGGGVQDLIFYEGIVRRVESLSCRNISFINMKKLGDVNATSGGIGDRNGGTESLRVIGGNFNQMLGYSLQYGQVKKVILGDEGVTYSNGVLKIPTISGHSPFLTYIKEGKRMNVIARNVSPVRQLNNFGYIDRITCPADDGEYTYVHITFKRPLTQPTVEQPLGDVISMFTEPLFTKIEGANIEGKIVNQDYFQMTYNPRIYDARIGQGYNVPVNIYGGAIRRMMVNVKKPYTGASSSALLRIESSYPSRTEIMLIDLKTPGLREVDFRGSTGKLGADVIPSIFEINQSQYKTDINLRVSGSLAGSSNDYAIVTFEADIVDV